MSSSPRKSQERTLPPFSALFSDVSTDNAPEAIAVKQEPPLDAANVKEEQVDVIDTVVATADQSNEIKSAFEGLNTELETGEGPVPPELQCRYRKGKCHKQRALKKNGSLHSYCELHRQRSVRNQKVFDQKRRQQREAKRTRPDASDADEERPRKRRLRQSS